MYFGESITPSEAKVTNKSLSELTAGVEYQPVSFHSELWVEDNGSRFLLHLPFGKRGKN